MILSFPLSASRPINQVIRIGEALFLLIVEECLFSTLKKFPSTKGIFRQLINSLALRYFKFIEEEIIFITSRYSLNRFIEGSRQAVYSDYLLSSTQQLLVLTLFLLLFSINFLLNELLSQWGPA